MKQILIEKYISPTKIIDSTVHITHIWADEDEELNSTLGQPCVVVYNKYGGEIVRQTWYKKGLLHRETCTKKNLPAVIIYNKNIVIERFYCKEGKEYLQKTENNSPPEIISEKLYWYIINDLSS
jgi:hypothetical protein